MITEYDEVKAILDKHDITDLDQIEYGSEVYEDLYNYFAESGEMPYGVMKARTGMPDDIDKGVWSEFAEEGLEEMQREEAEAEIAMEFEAESKRGK